MSVDNPYYFYNDKSSPKTPDSTTSSKGFSIFKRRNSKGSSPRVAIPEKIRPINSANLDSAASVLGSPRGSFGSLGSYSGGGCMHAFELGSPTSVNGPFLRRPNTIESFRERLGSYNETANYNPENDDVFNASPLSKNHHHTLPCHGSRRHSFGNFSQRDRLKSPTSPDEVPNMIAPKPPVVSPSRYRGTGGRRRDNCVTSSNMDDILIITAKHSERAILRANFLKNHFDKITKQRGRKPFNFLHVKIDDGPFSEDLARKYQDAALQIVILCPALLATSHSFLQSQLSAILKIEKVLAILLDVSEEKCLEFHKSALPSFRKWRRCVIRDNDQSQIGNILGIATDILGRALCQRPPCQDMNTSQTKSFSSSEGFTVLPRKVKIGQNKVVAMLNEPLDKDDVLKIMIEKSGELIEVRNFKRRNPFTIQFTIPESCMEISTMVEIRIEKNEKTIGSRPIKCESRLRELEQLLRTEDSPIEFMCHSLGIGLTERDSLDLHLLQCFQKNMPPNFHLLTGPFDKQNHFLTIRESSPEEYPTLLHFAARFGLDRLCIQLMECPGGDTACGVRNCVGKTPAELADLEGFHKLAQSINSFSEFHELTTMYHYFKGIQGDGANTKNKVMIEAKAGVESPKKQTVSRQKSHESKESAAAQAEYMDMSSGSDRDNSPCPAQASGTTMAVSNLNYVSVETEDDNLQSSGEMTKNFDQMKIITEAEVTTNELKISEPPYYQSEEKNKRNVIHPLKHYPVPEKLSQDVPDNCNASMLDYMLQPSNIPVQTVEDDGNYLFQPSNKPVELEKLPLEEMHQSRMNLNKMGSTSKLGTLKRTGSDASSNKGNADDELVEIMNDFKNNVLSIRDVEQLVEKWKHRNDVKQSFKEKQEQIELLRQEYERIQVQIKSNMKRETPFEKIKKLFSRHKTPVHKVTIESPDETKSSIASSFQSSQRPISTLSLQSVSSSSSSGRLSTGSACSGASLGDSGTHSDHEERRFGMCRIGSPGSLMDNYLVPPPPRPVLTPSSTPGEEKERIIFPHHPRVMTPTSPSPATNNGSNSDHYYMFPSNLPVFQVPNNDQSMSSSINSNGYLNTIVEAKENEHSYQNGVTVQPIKVQTLNDRSNIIYGKLTKVAPKDICSSFKPQAAPQVKKDVVAAEVYQNVPNGKLVCENGNGNEENHNYMNV
ncbi:phosphoinositide 3-kinase adapter protein 1 isoform X2 [Episyrphus balteatus]|uniref:phosphoinositide 3-kinase adapter protein 1 isoform X2 n=1 Tax=Episyrphus balteatus TaxID=286459 RepID=UPI002485B6D2|nr:phosphoinositide 3-kinase adapter protein 1 isoform X2 [Episyrphus balteatus]